MLSELKYQSQWESQALKVKEMLLKYNEGPVAEIKLGPYHHGAKVETIQSIKQFEDAMKNSGDKVVVVAFVNDQGHCKDAEASMDRFKNQYKEINFYKVNTKQSEELKNRYADGNSKPYFKFYRNGKVDSEVKYVQNWSDNEPALKAKLELYKVVGSDADSPDAILKDVNFNVFKQMSENPKFQRDEKDEDGMGFRERFKRPSVRVTFGEYKGTRYQGEWANNSEGLIDLEGWGILAS